LQRIVDRKKVSLRKFRNILIPINVQNSHWLLLNLNMERHSFDLLDSMSTSKDSTMAHAGLARQFLQDYFHATKSEVSAAVEDNTSLWSINVVKVTQQVNGSDCGMHTCQNMKLIAQGGNLWHEMSSERSLSTRR
jgi:Ulp1 family protease